MSLVYLDNNGTTCMLPEVLEQMLPCFTSGFGNASSMHTAGRRALATVRKGRECTAQLIGSLPAEIVFTSGGTESDNLALLGMAGAGDHVITSAIEHGAVLQTCAWLERQGCEVTRIGVGALGQVDPEDVRHAIRPNTKIISIMMANNETGVVQPVEEIGSIAREADIWFHTDAVQAAGKIPIDVRKIDCDLLSLTAHKMHGPQGTGTLYVRRGTPLKALLHGGHQEKSLRPGTENIAGIAGLGKACEVARAGLENGTVEHMRMLRDRLESTILASVPDCGINGRGAPRVPNTSSIYFDGVGGDAMVVALDKMGFAVSRGAACTSGEISPSSVLMAMGLSGERSRSSLRISLGKLNTEEDIEQLIEAIPRAVHALRASKSFFAQPATH